MQNDCLSVIESETGVCALCEQGFILNEEGNCVQDSR